ncbi:MAG: exodeoxyribonuclease VII large subunit [Saccharofermentanales bacterium]
MKESITVSQLNRYVNSILEADPNLSDLSVKGEISNFCRYPSGHLYFILKDANSSVSCVMFRSAAATLSFEPKEGQSVVIDAKASLYNRDGKFQLCVNKMSISGIGDLFAAFELLKMKLQQEGLFDQAHKKKIPYLPERIGVVTSTSGAVIRDIINVLNRRFPNFNMLIYPSAVQGVGAGQSIARALYELNLRDDIDVIIIARGGGSMEDLWCFNEEVVARAVYASEIPVISAVGHETDFTICDFVADLRAPTPSAAAELVMPLKSECTDRITHNIGKLTKSLYSRLDYAKLRLNHAQENRYFTHPEILYNQKKEEIDWLQSKMSQAFSHDIEMRKFNLDHIIARLDGLSPLKVLSRGYSVATKKISPGYSVATGRINKAVVRSINDVSVGDEINLRVIDGEIECSVLSAKEANYDKIN